jgi:hypothetical protein
VDKRVWWPEVVKYWWLLLGCAVVGAGLAAGAWAVLNGQQAPNRLEARLEGVLLSERGADFVEREFIRQHSYSYLVLVRFTPDERAESRALFLTEVFDGSSIWPEMDETLQENEGFSRVRFVLEPSASPDLLRVWASGDSASRAEQIMRVGLGKLQSLDNEFFPTAEEPLTVVSTEMVLPQLRESGSREAEMEWKKAFLKSQHFIGQNAALVILGPIDLASVVSESLVGRDLQDKVRDDETAMGVEPVEFSAEKNGNFSVIIRQLDAEAALSLTEIVASSFEDQPVIKSTYGLAPLTVVITGRSTPALVGVGTYLSPASVTIASGFLLGLGFAFLGLIFHATRREEYREAVNLAKLWSGKN